MADKKYTNRLINETSPYLQQHAHNPVDWYAWSDEALERSRKEDKPILLSIGYSACHWCHVMEQESFENENIAQLMNENFINIKVDREERPDLDAIYMQAVQILTGNGGWPLTVFLTPEQKPFYGGTYFPKDDRHGLPGFSRVLEAVASAYRDRRTEVENSAEQLLAHMNTITEPNEKEEILLSTNTLINAYVVLASSFDNVHGGFRSAPKFPESMILEFLLRYYSRTKDEEALKIVEHTLEKMARGGFYDQLGGGFHRYSVDTMWLVPHFEKMLYDNALLSRLYLHAYQVTGKQFYRSIVEETLEYVLREMTDKNGGFYATQDADSEGIEGKYYVWTVDEINQILGDDAKFIVTCYGVTKQGNFEGKNILNQVMTIETMASKFNIDQADLYIRLNKVKKKLLEKRLQRVPPHSDEKILTGWNGLMLASFAEAAFILNRPDYMDIAVANARFLTGELRKHGILLHSFKDGRTGTAGYLQDYALLCEGLISLYRSTFNEEWLTIAQQLADDMINKFWDNDKKCFYDTDKSQEALIVRPKNTHDSALPSGPSAAVSALLHLASLTGNDKYRKTVDSAFTQVQRLMGLYPEGFGHWLCAAEFYLAVPREIAIIGRLEADDTQLLVNEIRKRYLPHTTVVAGNEEHKLMPIPLLKDRKMINGEATAYVCEHYACQPPVVGASALASYLDKW